MKNILLTFALLLISLNLHSALLDKVVGVINERVFTHQEIKRIKSNLSGRKMIAPLIFEKTRYTDKEVLDILIQTHIINKKLAEMGISVSDAMVNSRIEEIEKAQGVSKSFLINYLKTKNLTYNEYFSLIKQMMEISYFNQRVIAPLVSITDSEVQDQKGNLKSKIKRSVIYDVTNYAFPMAVMKKYSNSEITNFLKKFQETGNDATLPIEFQGIQRNDLELESKTLTPQISKILKGVKTKSFSGAKEINGNAMVFYVKRRKYSNKGVPKISDNIAKQSLVMEKSKTAIKKWIASERNNFFIQTLI